MFHLMLLSCADPPVLVFGYGQPPEGYDPFTDPNLSAPQAAFECYQRPYFDKRGSRPSVDNLTEEKTAVNFDPVTAARTEFPMFSQIQLVYKVLA